MSKKCTACGFELKDDDVFCTSCGAKQDAAPAGAPNVAADPINSYVEKAKKNPLLLIIPAAAILLFVIILIAIIVAVFAGGAYKKPLNTYEDVFFSGKADRIEKLAPEEYWDYIEEKYDITVKDVIKYYEDEEYFEKTLDALEEDCGKNIKVKYKVEEKDELTDKELDSIKEALKAKYDIPRKNVTKAYELDVEWTVKGKDDEKDDEQKMTVVKIDGKWYIYDGESFNDMLSTLILAVSMDKAADNVEDGLGGILPDLG